MENRNYNRRFPKEYGFLGSLFYIWFLNFVVAPIGKLLYDIKIEGRENIDKKRKYLFAPNHVSYLDPPFTSLAGKRKVAYMAKQELFTDKNALLRFLVIHLGAFAVNRENPEIATFKTVFDLLKTDWSLGIFPQGKISKENAITTVQKGFVTIAKKAKFDIVPIGICGFDGYSKKLFGKHMTVKVGKPISYKLDDTEIIKQWAAQICELTGLENRLEL